MLQAVTRIRDGKAYAVSELTFSSDPMRRRLWFLLDVDPCRVKDGSPAHYNSSVQRWGIALAPFGLGSQVRALGDKNEHGSTIAAIIEDEPIPCPRVRKGTETRWNGTAGRWEKLLKAGWVEVSP
jgi:hypothetical protein